MYNFFNRFLDEIDERESPSSDSRRETAKFGRCTWCKNYGNLNDYSTNLQGREIYCTGLCSKKCFEQAALKIINVETGYGLESSVYSESTPIRTSINLSSLNNEQDISRGEHLSNFARTYNEGSRSGVEAARPSTEVIRDKTVQRPQPKMARPSSSLQIQRTGMIRVSNINDENNPEEQMRSSVTGNLVQRHVVGKSYFRDMS